MLVFHDKKLCRNFAEKIYRQKYAKAPPFLAQYKTAMRN